MIIKIIAINCCYKIYKNRKQRRKETAPLVPKDYIHPKTPRSAALSPEEIQVLKDRAVSYSNDHYWSAMRIGTGKKHTPEEIEKAKKFQLDYILKIIDTAEFRKDPVAYMEAWKRHNTSPLSMWNAKEFFYSEGFKGIRDIPLSVI